ncbi:hypothetical protein RYX56_10925 [Alkalihalophilus lindianensis]|uniref:Uncharacterized protein n=1 Tax=Alkalihalophilus lindianensis TaxID=1630542 RepID=A0ABU3XAF9_9BACI|nr:hypothetical protein [Alkalihalophilus lindianensis]MDV2684881.1 hypothetical protein [Alkalihalophilus lindianensis]
MMGRKYRRYYHRPPWWLKIRAMFAQLLLPLICFQFLRTLLFPTTFDVILLTLMFVLYCSLLLKLF